MNKTDLYQNLLNAFDALPKPNMSPTFMEICQMCGDRFEERCSQVLKFYIDPTAEHKLHGLFIDSFLKELGYEDYRYDPQTVKVLTEETTENMKRIDITIIADSFVIAIENKIDAALYNDLSSYVNYIETQYADKDNRWYIVLSGRQITDVNEMAKMKANGYHYINYETLFSTVKEKLGYYALDCDQYYLNFLFDFIRTIEKRYNSSNMEINRFFLEKGKAIEDLYRHYSDFMNKVLEHQKQNIVQLLPQIQEATGAEWWIWHGWDLGISFNDQGNKIGIESSYSDPTYDEKMAPPHVYIGDFHIYITVWNKKCFNPYREELMKLYPDCWIDDSPEGAPDRVYLHLPVIKDNNHGEIIKNLTECYNKMKEITDRIK